MNDETDAPGQEHAEPAALPAATQAAPALDAEHPVDVMLRNWVADRIHNSPVATVTEAFNHLTTIALPELARRLKGNF